MLNRSGESEHSCFVPDFGRKAFSVFTVIYGMEWYSAIKKKNEIMSFTATWLDLEIIILSEVSQTEKDKYHMI